jgi:hypothetical protein
MASLQSDTAMVTLAIGEPYLSSWKKYCAGGWEAYATKHHYDLVVLTEPLDRSPRAAERSPAWQKCLVLGQEFAARYRRVVLLDCDIAINADRAPAITEQVPEEFVGGVLSGAHIHDDLRVVLLERLTRRAYEYEPGVRHWQEFQDEAYRSHGLTPASGGVVQTGVLVASPQHHRALFASVYQSPQVINSRCHEQMFLSHALLSQGLYRPIDSRFNSVLFETMLVHYPNLLDKGRQAYDELARYAIRVALANNFFVHFAYGPELVRFLTD